MFSAHAEFERLHVRQRAGSALVVGSRLYKNRPDRRALYPAAVGVDMLPGDGVDVVCDLEAEAPALGRFEHVDCVSVLEHARRPWRVARNIERLLVPGGTLYLTAPFVWRVHAYPSDYFRFTVEGVRALFGHIEWQQLLYGDDTGLGVDAARQGRRFKDGPPHFARCEVLGFGVRR